MEIRDEEAAYLMGATSPIASSVLTSTSRFLNNPRFRDIYAQMGLKRDGYDLPTTYLIPEIQRAIDEETDMPRLRELLAAERERLPEFAQWLDARFTSDWRSTDLSAFAEGTLGARIRAFIETSGMDIDFMFRGAPSDDYEFMTKRRVQSHDVEHMVTGFDTTQTGEIALIVTNSVAIHNYFTPELAGMLTLQPMFLASTSLMRIACHYPAALPAMLEGFALGQAMGTRQRRPLFMIRWEDWLGASCATVRKELGLEGGPTEGHWASADAIARG